MPALQPRWIARWIVIALLVFGAAEKQRWMVYARQTQGPAAAKPGKSAASQSTPSISGAGTPKSASPAEGTVNTYLVVIDPAHGGADLGSRFNATANEKDIALAFARRLRDELKAQNISSLLLRDSDIQMTAEQRAQAANAAHASLFISIHAAPPSGEIRLYTSLLLPSPTPANNKAALFLPWESAQGPVLNESRGLAAKAVEGLHKDQIAAFAQPALLPPLNSIVVPAIAIELSPENQNDHPGKKGEGLIGPEYQARVARVLAAVIAAQAPATEATP
ncbi:MAG TPA: N-acetylmuramoyl-L-alanine amidase [Terriglobales bacterium]